MPVEWSAVRIPQALRDRIDKLIAEELEWGYNSASSFVTDAIRRHLIYLDEMKAKKNR